MRVTPTRYLCYYSRERVIEGARWLWDFLGRSGPSLFLIHPSSPYKTQYRPSISDAPSKLPRVYFPARYAQAVPMGFRMSLATCCWLLPIHTPQALTPTSPWPRWLCSVVNMSLSFGVIVVVAWLGFEIWETSISATENTKVRNKKDVKEKLLAEFSNPSYFRHTFPEIGN